LEDKIMPAILKPKPVSRFHTGYTIEQGATQGMLCNYYGCRVRMANFLNGWTQVTGGGSNRAIDFGSLFHGMLEAWYLAPEGSDPVDVSYDYAKEYRKGQLEDGADANDTEEDIAMMLGCFLAYTEKWKKSDAMKTWVALEKVFDVKFHGYRMRGRRDGLFKFSKSNGLWLTERKTFSRDDNLAAREACLNFDFQNQYYIVAAEEEYGEPVVGVEYDMIRKPGLKNWDSPKDLTKRVVEDAMARPDFYFRRYEIVYPASQIKKFREEELLPKFQEFEKWVSGDKTYATFRNQPNACYGKWNCSYIAACANDGFSGYDQSGELFGELQD